MCFKLSDWVNLIKKPRPLKGSFADEAVAKSCLKNTRKLLQSRPNIRLNADLTPMQCNYIKYLYRELEERKNKGEQDVVINNRFGVPRIIKKLNSKLMIYCQNVGGMKSKINDFKLAVSTCSYDVIILMEAWSIEEISSEELELCDFNIYRFDRNLKICEKASGGGVLISI